MPGSNYTVQRRVVDVRARIGGTGDGHVLKNETQQTQRRGCARIDSQSAVLGMLRDARVASFVGPFGSLARTFAGRSKPVSTLPIHRLVMHAACPGSGVVRRAGP
jgi:hypothetical protein